MTISEQAILKSPTGDRSFRTDFSPVETHIAFLSELAFLVSFNDIDLRRPILEKKPSS